MLCNVNVTLNKCLNRKCLLFVVYKYLTYRFYLARQFVHWYFAKLHKQSLGFVVICIKDYMSVRQQEMCCLNVLKLAWNYKEFQIQLET